MRNRQAHSRSTHQGLTRARLGLEVLEDRTAPAVLLVTSTADSGAGSLRSAVSTANGTPEADTIRFDPSLNRQTITLSTVGDNTFGPSALVVNTTITLEGTPGGVTIARGAAAPAFRLFAVATSGHLIVKGLTLQGGLARGGDGGDSSNGGAGGGAAGLGGGIFNRGILTLLNSTLQDHQAIGGNGGTGGVNTGHLNGAGAGGLGGRGSDSTASPSGNSSSVPTGGPSGDGAGGNGGVINLDAGGIASFFNQANGTSGKMGGGGGGGAGLPLGFDITNDLEPFGISAGAGGFGGGGGGAPRGYIFGQQLFAGISGAGGFGGGAGGGDTSGTTSGVGGGGGGAGLGGAIFNYGGTVGITNSTVVNNTARGGNGGSGVGGSTQGEVNGQGGTGMGGGLFNLNGTAILTHATFANNTIVSGLGRVPGAPSGAEVYSLSGTVVGFGDPAANATTTLVNSLLSNGVGVDIATVDRTAGASTLTATGKNLLRQAPTVRGGATSNASGVQTSNPLLDVLKDNYGPTRTLALGIGSPALDAGDLLSVPLIDQRGVARGDKPDLGAFEVNNPVSPVGVPEDLYAPHPNASANEAYIKGLYRATFQRDFDGGGLNFWLGHLNNGLSRDVLAQFFYNSDENRSAQVTFLYRFLLGRDPDGGGLNFWRGALQGGVPEATVIEGILLSGEFSQRADNATFVNTVYFASLGRSPEPGGFDFWIQTLQAGALRGTVTNAIVRSSESAGRIVQSFFVSFFKRKGTDTEINEFRSQVLQGRTFGQIAMAMLASDEFFRNAQTGTP